MRYVSWSWRQTTAAASHTQIVNNPSSSGCGGRTTSESHQRVIRYLSAFAAKTNLSHKEELANHPDLPDPMQSAAEERRLLKSLTRSTQKDQKGTLITTLDFSEHLAGAWKVNNTTKIESCHWYCLETRQVHAQKKKEEVQLKKYGSSSLLLRFPSSCKY